MNPPTYHHPHQQQQQQQQQQQYRVIVRKQSNGLLSHGYPGGGYVDAQEVAYQPQSSAKVTNPPYIQVIRDLPIIPPPPQIVHLRPVVNSVELVQRQLSSPDKVIVRQDNLLSNHSNGNSSMSVVHMHPTPPAVGTIQLQTQHLQHQPQRFENMYTDHVNLSIVMTNNEVSFESKKMKFPRLLYKILSDAEKGSFMNILSWRPHGRSFIINEPKSFEKLIMPKYYPSSKWKSFRRQLNLYDFTRIQKGPDTNAYYHPCFLRGRPDLLNQIVRRPEDSSSNNRPVGPDFFKMGPISPPPRFSS